MVKSTAVLPLPFAASDDTQSRLPQTRTDNRLWLALHLPQFALETLTQAHNNTPAAVYQVAKGRKYIHSASQAAVHHGITAHMTLSAAYALYPDLQLLEYDDAALQQRLQQLATWATRFTSKVSIHPPQSLVLEVGGSLILFNGLQSLQDALIEQLNQIWRHRVDIAVSPTPAASLLLARFCPHTRVLKRQALRSALGPVPIDHLPFDPRLTLKLKRVGVRILRDIWRLPKDGLARRFGQELTLYVDRLLGHIAEPLNFFSPNAPFQAGCRFTQEITDTAAILTAAQRLLGKLAVFLRHRDTSIDTFTVQLHHYRRPASIITVALRHATRDNDRMMLLLSERLRAQQLAAAVTALSLRTEAFQDFAPRTEALALTCGEQTAPDQNQAPDITPLLEELQARLGHSSIHGIQTCDDHRPEHAFKFNDASLRPNTVSQNNRPLWLLSQPLPLRLERDTIWHQGPLTLRSGPERIEAGWWAHQDIRRDYYVAANRNGNQLWIYEDLSKPGTWYLHGLYA